MATHSFTLGSSERLKNKKQIELLFKEGRSFAYFPLRIIYLLHDSASLPALQAGFSVPKKIFKKAVDRNRIKRLLRECYRLQKQTLQNTTDLQNKKIALFIIFTGKELPAFDLVLEKMEECLLRVIQKIGEESSYKNRSV